MGGEQAGGRHYPHIRASPEAAMLATAMSASVVGVDGVPVRVEVDVAFGLPGLTIVGLAGSAVLESRERVRSAIRNTGFELPARRITVNLAPADLPKDGTAHDLALAVGVLAASGQLDDGALQRTAFLGELALDGSLRPVPGVLALVTAAVDSGAPDVLVPAPNGAEAAAVPGAVVHPASTLREVVRHLVGLNPIPPLAPVVPDAAPSPRADIPNLSSVVGQRVARRALEIATAGAHNLALTGPPGVGKTMLARAAAGLLPPLDDGEAAEVSRIHSVAGLGSRSAAGARERPFRSPHHTISTQALVGGGPRVRPGEASLAHRGALFLDETLQFRADALDALRGPLDSGAVLIARVDRVLALPARFMLLAAFNPCPCGWFNVHNQVCTCEDGARRRYQARLSGPMRDRLDLLVPLEPGSADSVSRHVPEPTASVATRVLEARRCQVERQGSPNAELAVDSLGDANGISQPIRGLMETRVRQMDMSLRRAHRLMRVARTIADLDGSDAVQPRHLDEAIGYRPKAVAA